MTTMSQVQGHVTNLAANRGNVPLLRLALGLLLLAFFLLALMLQVQTSEAFILQSNVVSFGANWGILVQPFDLLQGKLSVSMAEAIVRQRNGISCTGYETSRTSDEHTERTNS